MNMGRETWVIERQPSRSTHRWSIPARAHRAGLPPSPRQQAPAEGWQRAAGRLTTDWPSSPPTLTRLAADAEVVPEALMHEIRQGCLAISGRRSARVCLSTCGNGSPTEAGGVALIPGQVKALARGEVGVLADADAARFAQPANCASYACLRSGGATATGKIQFDSAKWRL